MAVEYLDNGNDDGTILGRSGDKIGFYGTTAVTQPTIGTYTAALSTASATTSSPYGFATSTQADDIAIAVKTISATLSTLGIQSS